MKTAPLYSAFQIILEGETKLKFYDATERNDEVPSIATDLQINGDKTVVRVFMPDMQEYNSFVVNASKIVNGEAEELEQTETSDMREVCKFIEEYQSQTL